MTRVTKYNCECGGYLCFRDGGTEEKTGGGAAGSRDLNVERLSGRERDGREEE